MSIEYVKLPTKYVTTKIKSVEFDYNVPTYDIEVENSHYYKTADGIISHNTLSLMHPTMILSYGVEPAFSLYYWKRTRMAGKYEYYFIVPSVVRKIFKNNGIELPMKSDTIKDTWDGKHGKEIAKIIDENKDKFHIKFKPATDIKAIDKLDLMSKLQKNVDSSMSVTYLLPENTTWKTVYNFIIEAHKKEIKSIAAFTDKKMYGIVSFVPFKDLALKLKEENIEMHPQNFSEDELKELHLSNEFIVATRAPKRPTVLDADVYSITAKGSKFVVAVGLLQGAPYEIFCGKMNGVSFKFKEKKGTLTKIKQGQYKLDIGDEVSIEDFSAYFKLKPIEAALFIMASGSLRHGMPVKFAAELLTKREKDIGSLVSAAARVLKKYIKDGELVPGLKCPKCENTHLVYNKGCVECPCGWSRCD